MSRTALLMFAVAAILLAAFLASYLLGTPQGAAWVKTPLSSATIGDAIVLLVIHAIVGRK